ncbi:alpha/beta hydrolase [Williamsia sp.]|uniref:alpha/beta fold hydrolase n=1 Tax=Williamsia sp. TaxID=1872085 RepID=UPI0025CD92CE|nr:alpha/beta hydrolase [Williamsia sp.]
MDRAINPVDSVSISYRTVGDGPPVVMLHATALSQAMWRAFGYVAELRDSHRLVLMDFRGHGRSGKPHSSSAYGMELLVGDVLAVLDEERIDRADVFGYSLGSRVALSMATSAPDRVRRLVLGGTSSRVQAGAFDALFFPGCAAVLAESGMDAFIDRWEQRRGTPVDPATRMAFSVNDATALAAYMRELDRDPGVPDSALATLVHPTLAFVGSDDDTRLADTEHVVETIPDARMLVVPGRDHATTPAASEEILAEVAPFLT